MRIIAQSDKRQRKLYASVEVVGKNDDGSDREGFFVSAMEVVKDGRRPVARFDSRQELELEAFRRGCQVVWSDNG